ncbi:MULTISPECIES: putative leader peptide [Mycobacterium]|uniref:putative leader peptide n=1 Tax=Mycobacterium TaxID=1763 RepID=UPI000C07E110
MITGSTPHGSPTPAPLLRRSPDDTVGLITASLGKLTDVSARLELKLTKRRAVDLCRITGCCCCCCCSC